MYDDHAPGHAAAGLRRHVDAENAHDLDALAATFAENGVMVLNGETYRGRALIRRVHEAFGFGGSGAFADLHVREVARYVDGSAIVVEEVLSGRHVGPWDGIAPTGRTFEVPVCGVYVFDASGALTAERVYFDAAGVARQLRGT